MTYDQIMRGENQFLWIKYPNRLADAKYGFVIDPKHPKFEIDMVHFLVVGKMGHFLGFANEYRQYWYGIVNVNAAKSAFYIQDLYSNYLGVEFFKAYGQQLMQNPNHLAKYIEEFLKSENR